MKRQRSGQGLRTLLFLHKFPRSGQGPPWPWALSPMTCVADAHLGLPVLTADGVGHPLISLTITP